MLVFILFSEKKTGTHRHRHTIMPYVMCSLNYLSDFRHSLRLTIKNKLGFSIHSLIRIMLILWYGLHGHQIST